MKKMLSQLREKFDEETGILIKWIDNGGGFESDIFETPVEFKVNEDRPLSLRGFLGVYVFMMIEDKHLTYEDVKKWCLVKGAQFPTWHEYDLQNGKCLYAGSCSSESLFVRMGQHFKADNTVSSLNINHPYRLILRDSIRIIAFPLKEEFNDYGRIIVTSVEERLHKKLEPITGSSRV